MMGQIEVLYDLGEPYVRLEDYRAVLTRAERAEAERAELQKRIKSVDEMVKIQSSDGNWNYNEYMRGLANGLLFAQAVMNDRDYEPLDVPENYVEQRPNVRGPFIRRKE